MSKVCSITGKKTLRGNKVSHSNIKTKRVFNPNLQLKKFWLEDENRWITLKITTKAMRIIDKIGIKEAMKRAEVKGLN